MGELGRIVLQSLSNGHYHVSSEVAGDLDDPMTAARKELLEPLSEQATSALEAMLGKGVLGNATTPVSPQGKTQIVKSKIIPCERCGNYAALLIFAENAGSAGDFEDCARKMYHKYTTLDVPTWIIGP